MFDLITFYLFSALVIASFCVVVFSKNILYAMSALAAGMIFISGLFFTLGAEFLGVVQISVYTGAVMALYAFGMMFFDSTKEVREIVRGSKIIAILSVGCAVMVAFIVLIPRVVLMNVEKSPTQSGNIESLGMLLFTKYLLPFEIAAVMLLIAMIAGIALVKKDLVRGDSSDSSDLAQDSRESIFKDSRDTLKENL